MEEKNYKIQINYTTGDSFGSEDRSSDVEMQWNKLEVAQENLKRIEEHYEFYRKQDSWGRRTLSADEREQLKQEAINTAAWAVVPDEKLDKHMNEHRLIYCVKLKEDDGVERSISCFWTGYFESLNSAEIVTNEKKFKIEF